MTNLLIRAESVKVLVAGDCMLDAYIDGHANRISPEAPVPVVDVARRSRALGGAGNVAANIRGTGAQVSLAGIIGADPSGVTLRAEVARLGMSANALMEDPGRVTTTKTRVTVAGQQIVRYDDETREPLSAASGAQLIRLCGPELESSQAAVISDYAKGVVFDSFCRWMFDQAQKRNMPVVVDPKSRDLSRYSGATVITPNLKEALAAAGESPDSRSDVLKIGERLLAAVAPSAILVTRGADGMTLFEPGRDPVHYPALVSEVADVTGAGDTVVAILAVALGAGLSLPEAARIANIAAGVAVGHHGTWAVNRDELLAASRSVAAPR